MFKNYTHKERTDVNPNNEHLHKEKYPDHWERYFFAVNFLSGNKIIDIASGPGYGTALLSKHSNTRVVGLDIDEKTIETSKKNYGFLCDFYQINGYDWPFESNQVDCIVSLETFEHLDNPDKFLAEAYRVLKTGGKLILSTPLNETNSRYKPENPYHLREYTWNELGDKISKHFNIVERFSQISKIGEINSSVDNSKLKFIKRIIPSKIKFLIIKLLHKSSLKAGSIIKGKKLNASVQLVIAEK